MTAVIGPGVLPILGAEREHNPRTAADVNGDGRADLIGFGNRGVHVKTN